MHADERERVCRSKAIEMKELEEYLKTHKSSSDLGKWTDAEVQELFDFLDVDKDGKVSLHDFAGATIGPLQREQLRCALKTKQLGDLLADAMPFVPGWDEQGKLRPALEQVAKLDEAGLAKVVAENAHKVLEPACAVSALLY